MKGENAFLILCVLVIIVNPAPEVTLLSFPQCRKDWVLNVYAMPTVQLHIAEICFQLVWIWLLDLVKEMPLSFVHMDYSVLSTNTVSTQFNIFFLSVEVLLKFPSQIKEGNYKTNSKGMVQYMYISPTQLTRIYHSCFGLSSKMKLFFTIHVGLPAELTLLIFYFLFYCLQWWRGWWSDPFRWSRRVWWWNVILWGRGNKVKIYKLFHDIVCPEKKWRLEIAGKK